MSDTDPCPPLDNPEQLSLPFPDDPPWSILEGEPLGLLNPPGEPCYCNEECNLNSHRKP